MPRKGHYISILASVAINHETIPKPYCCIHSDESNSQGLVGDHYDVNSGPIEVIDVKTLRIREFTFSGTQAPDGWIFVGKGEIAKKTGQKAAVLLNNGAASFCPLLQDFDGSTHLIVRLPDSETVYTISYISVYCYQYGVDFGHVNFRLLPEQVSIPAFIPPLKSSPNDPDSSIICN
uniref:DM13 domain-containing protein n=1 Tax=Syphacia muris TaxID=451379 RepID=A0A0N5A7L3_9BILA